MQSLPQISDTQAEPAGHIKSATVCCIAAVAALGGFLFGYDWVVIGGAKPFYEVYFHLQLQSQIGWANSCALVGCLLGSLAAGALGERLGRKKLLAAAALLFTLSSVLTGWSHAFAGFILWRIVGGVAIGLASNISPTYIAEISPSPWRGRLVSLNQLALVTGILAAQIVNWRIARPIPAGLNALAVQASWNVQYGWRWMFTAVAVPGIVFLFSAAAIPESPRWLMMQGLSDHARNALGRLGDANYADAELHRIRASIHNAHMQRASLRDLLAPSLRSVLLIGIALTVLQQWSGINVLFNYAEEVYRSAGYGTSGILFNIVITGVINLAFTIVSMLCVDRFGRRPLILLGCAGVGMAHIATACAYWLGLHGPVVLSITLAAIAFYAASLAPVTWVLITEIFPTRVRSLAISLAVTALWAAAFILTYTFPLLNKQFGTGGTFFAYGLICLAGGVFVYFRVPETKGRSLEQLAHALSLSD